MTNNLIHEIRLTNLLSFGLDTEPIALRPLNVLIGPNGSGKSNLLEAIGLLRAAPKDLSAQVKEAGGVRDLLWKGARNPVATIEATIENPVSPEKPLRHVLSFAFAELEQRFEVTAESIEYRVSDPGERSPHFIYQMENDLSRLSEMPEAELSLQRRNRNPQESILSQVKDPERYPCLAYLSDVYSRFRLYSEWSFGRYTQPRQPQKADLSSQYLKEETCENLALVLNALRPHAKKELLEALSALYPEIEDFNVQIVGGWVQLFLEEGRFSIPATRLSDGTLRYLCLLAILCHPEPPPLVCIEEPELGLHPDVLPTLVKLMVAASERCQLIVTTHSDAIVDELTETPESVIVCEKHNDATTMKRLNQTDLQDWLKKYTLGELWRKGELGGNRW